MSKYSVMINDCTKEEAIELVEHYAGGAVVWCDRSGRPIRPKLHTGPMVCYPKNEACSVVPFNGIGGGSSN